MIPPLRSLRSFVAIQFRSSGLTRKPELKPQLARMALIKNDLETNIASKSEAGALNETRLTSVKSAKSAVLISEFGLNWPRRNLNFFGGLCRPATRVGLRL
jgi:hypothetical protein